jgi:rhodanese-related sulfurtransferase
MAHHKAISGLKIRPVRASQRCATVGNWASFDASLNRLQRLIFAAPEATLAPDGRGRTPQNRLSGGLRVADHQVHDLTPEDVAKGMAEGRYLLVDVREPNEVAVEAYPGAVVVPLQSFDPAAIPDPKGKEVVFACRSGKRSVTASLAAQAAGLRYDKHLAGGILAWKAAGLQTKTGG